DRTMVEEAMAAKIMATGKLMGRYGTPEAVRASSRRKIFSRWGRSHRTGNNVPGKYRYPQPGRRQVPLGIPALTMLRVFHTG
ncbi:MAG TPA: hypothetical protein VHC48_01640, partial [Puia sp.]|nr:hypothetical protein [Puia sp.]